MFFSFVNFWDSKQFSSIYGKQANIRLTSTQIKLEHWAFSQTFSKEKCQNCILGFKPETCTYKLCTWRAKSNKIEWGTRKKKLIKSRRWTLHGRLSSKKPFMWHNLRGQPDAKRENSTRLLLKDFLKID